MTRGLVVTKRIRLGNDPWQLSKIFTEGPFHLLDFDHDFP